MGSFLTNFIVNAIWGKQVVKPAAGYDGQYLYYNDTTGKFEYGVPGGSGYSRFDPNKPPSSPSALDDEFNETSLDAKWTGVNLASLTAYDFNTTVPGCWYGQVANTGATLFSLLQAIPAGDFTVYTKAHMLSQNLTNTSFLLQQSLNAYFGIILADGVTAGAGNQTYAYNGLYQSVPSWLGVSDWTNFNTPGASKWSGVDNPELFYMAIRRSSTAYSIGWSSNGVLWTWKTFSQSYTPTYFGPAILCSQAARADIAFDFFRYFPSATAVLGGWSS